MDVPVLVLYGSQTGNAQDVAERIGREARLLLFSPRIISMDAYDVSLLPTEPSAAIIFVISTTGQGEFPDNAKRFWRFILRKSLATNSLAAVRFALFGLGDSGYPKYNVASKKLFRRLSGLGATPVLDQGLGDDQHPSGYEAALDRWLPLMWSSLRGANPLPTGIEQPVLDESTLLDLGQPRYRVTFLEGEGDDNCLHLHSGRSAFKEEDQRLMAGVALAAAFKRVADEASGNLASPSSPPPASMSNEAADPSAYGPWWPFLAPVITNRRITSASHFQDTRHLELSLSGSGTMESYLPGDILCVWPRPDPSSVDAFLGRMGWDGDQIISVQASSATEGSAGQGETATGTVRTFVEGVLDVAGASPRRRFFQVLARFTPESAGTIEPTEVPESPASHTSTSKPAASAADVERERLLYFASAEGRDDLYQYNQREGRTVLEVLQDFRCCRLPLEWLLEVCPLMKPRQFSISSSSRMHPGEAHLTVAVVDWTTLYKRKRRGLCSSYLANVSPLPIEGGGSGGQHRVAVWVERGSLRMPKDPRVPLILIGPGTGIAPFRAFLEERAAMLRDHNPGGSSGALGPGLPSSSEGAAGAKDPGLERSLAPPPDPPAACSLFLGCRGMHSDCYYLEQWRGMQEEGVLLSSAHGLCIAASRDQPQKVYVTHKLKEHAEAVWNMIDHKGAEVYVSGSAQKMPSDVITALVDVAMQAGGLSQEAAQQYVHRMELQGRYHVEAW